MDITEPRRGLVAARRTDRTLDKGHGTEALGPSNSSDSGSDVATGDAGAMIGDTDLSADSDAEGTGERAAAGRDDNAVLFGDRRVSRVGRGAERSGSAPGCLAARDARGCEPRVLAPSRPSYLPSTDGIR
jgi:hypothetical protein